MQGTNITTLDEDSAISVGLPNKGKCLDRSLHSSTATSTSLTPEDQAAQDQENADAVERALSTTAVDDENELSDAGYETDSRMSQSTSITSLAQDYVYENGWRYHKFREGRYNFPNDETEQSRENVKHVMMVTLCQVLHFAPVARDPQNILDMGTGTGMWAIEMGDRYPSAVVVGADLSPIQPSWVPPNVKFIVDDVEDEWVAPLNHYDYIHARHTVMAIKDWPSLMKNVYGHLKPGAWFELQEIHHVPQCHDATIPPDHPIVRYWNVVFDGLAALGVNAHATLTLAEKLRAAGFVDVTERILYVPIGTWPKNQVLKRIGLYWRAILMDGIEPIALAPLTRGLKWDLDHVESFLSETREGYTELSIHAHMPLHIIYGQRPVEDRMEVWEDSP